MKAPLYSKEGKQVGDVTLSESLFGVRWNSKMVQEVVVALQTNRRAGTAHTKDRGDVRGGGKKPWQQKGTGRARHGSSRSPIWIGGGVTHGPTSEKNYSKKINKVVKRKALATVLSKKLKEGEVYFVEDLVMPNPKTKEAFTSVELFGKNVGIEKLGKKGGRALLLLEKPHPETIRAFRNLPYITIEEARNVNVEEALIPKYIVLTKNAADSIKA
ncbi:MAG: 50S ribosomal protein L4 [bacterium]|nr:50S ribosomal protein L4 [bacterium]